MKAHERITKAVRSNLVDECQTFDDMGQRNILRLCDLDDLVLRLADTLREACFTKRESITIKKDGKYITYLLAPPRDCEVSELMEKLSFAEPTYFTDGGVIGCRRILTDKAIAQYYALHKEGFYSE